MPPLKPLLRLNRPRVTFPNAHPPHRTFLTAPPSTHHETHHLGYTPKQLYALVSNINSYHLFVPWCAHSQVLSHKKLNGKEILKAELGVGFRAFSENYVSEVTCVPYERVQAVASNSTLFRTLITTWNFAPGTPTNTTPDSPTTHVDFSIAFQFKSPLYAHLSNLFFEEVSKVMVGAFEERARKVYGPPAIVRRLGDRR
ncbi:hypothetical protein SpCBS45565_g04661 [Spizellomyces sp. 'palustris']|nr:hypothetical protein SpCBS45565_g04661 [Spizellomyces sp. 'palustris']